MFDVTELIWNRAALEAGGAAPRIGDRHLAALLRVHGEAMSSGVLHAAETATDDGFAVAIDGYRFFGLDSVAAVLIEVRARASNPGGVDDEADVLEPEADRRYGDCINDRDETIFQAFRTLYESDPDLFSPVGKRLSTDAQWWSALTEYLQARFPATGSEFPSGGTTSPRPQNPDRGEEDQEEGHQGDDA